MSSAGEILRAERVRQGLELAKVSAQTRISVKYLQAIEGDDPSSLPGSFFYRSFAHQYADFLGVDHEAVDSELDQLAPVAAEPTAEQTERFTERLDVPPLPAERRSSTPSRLPMALVFLVTAIIASSAIYALWQRWQQPAESQHVEVPKPVVPAAAPEPAKPQEAQTSASGDPAPPTSQPVSTSTPPTSTPAAPPTGTPNAAPAQTAVAQPGKPLSLELMATEDVWVSVTSDGNEVVKRVLKAGEKRTVTGAERVTLLSGNAGGLIVAANGKVLDQIGPRGQVRIVEVTPEGVQVRGPTPKKPAGEQEQ